MCVCGARVVVCACICTDRGFEIAVVQVVDCRGGRSGGGRDVIAERGGVAVRSPRVFGGSVGLCGNMNPLTPYLKQFIYWGFVLFFIPLALACCCII